MAYGVIIYEQEHDNFMSMTPEKAGLILQNMIRTFRGEEAQPIDGDLNIFSVSICNRVATDNGKAISNYLNGLKGGAPKGNTNAAKNNRKTTEKQPKQPSKTTKTTHNSNNNSNSNSNNNSNNNSNSNNKLSYGTFDNVFLTDEEYIKLKDKFPDYQNRIDNLSEYLKSKGDKYKDHYATILNWARRDEGKVKSYDAVRDRLKVVDSFT